MKKFLLFLLIVLYPSVMFAAEKVYIEPIQLYKSNYFITGDSAEDQVKFQLSIRYPLIWPFDTGVYFGYTQLSYWRIYDQSSPFEETNYMPEFFYKIESKKNPFDLDMKAIDYIQVSPISHRSNGQPAGIKDRSENKYYIESQASIGAIYNIGIRGKFFGYYNVARGNKDINDYHRNYEAGIFFRNMSKSVELLEKESVEFSCGGNPVGKGWMQVEVSARIITSYFQPRIFVQFFSGYDEFMVHYDQKTTALRAGVTF